MGRHGLLVAVALLVASPTVAQQEGVTATVHNLSVSGPGSVRALDETEVCKFCHIPHNPVAPEQLWGHALSKVARYDTPRIQRGAGASEPTPQPDGSSRLCLSCHDGTVALGDIGREGPPVAMTGAQRLDPGSRGHLGTDLSGSHPISFVMPDGDPGRGISERDMGLRPLSAVQDADGVRLDDQGKMQCTTCHDPHSDQYYVPDQVPHFWVRPTIDEVCLACHELR